MNIFLPEIISYFGKKWPTRNNKLVCITLPIAGRIFIDFTLVIL